FQNYALYPHVTVAKNMAFSLMLNAAPKEEIDRRVNYAAGILGLMNLLDRYPRQLSGGQRQRVAMGRAIVRDPQVFLFDEPLSNLDAKLRVAMRAEIKELHHRLKTTTVYVTHDQIEAMTMADRIVAMHDGIVQQVGSPLEIYDRPANMFVASFIGSPAMNFLRGVLTSDAGRPALKVGGVSIPLASPLVSLHERPVVIGVRPEHVEISDDPSAPFAAQVDLVEPMGVTTLVHAWIADEDVKILSLDRPRLSTGAPIRLKLLPDRLHLFDAATEARLV
ncbi:MAG: ATP-binding cassette domain-containing protein, partial [Bauldia sp.]|nr:ATP-binding cassette domain-containing protein [Bauldia sp.]